MSVGNKIKELCIQCNVTQRELSERTAIPRATLSRYLNDRATPKADALYAIARVLNVPMEYFCKDD